MAFLGVLGKTLGLGSTRQVLGSVITGGAISPFSSAQAAESAPQNVQQTVELASSGEEGFRSPGIVGANVGNNLPIRLRPGYQISDRVKDIVGGLGGGALLDNIGNLFGGGDVVCGTESSMKPFSVNKANNCITVTRKQQARLKEMVSIVGLEQTADAIGLDTDTLVLLLLKRFKQRGRGITAASMRTTKRTIRQIKSLHNEVSSMAKRAPARRASTVKQVKYSN
tara:strand:+ start:818 stop:1492 length:675 start_codon:yes stop_codon:yes gene_type:complete